MAGGGGGREKKRVTENYARVESSPRFCSDFNFTIKSSGLFRTLSGTADVQYIGKSLVVLLPSLKTNNTLKSSHANPIQVFLLVSQTYCAGIRHNAINASSTSHSQRETTQPTVKYKRVRGIVNCEQMTPNKPVTIVQDFKLNS
jgi:hypothetical protein